MLKKTEAIRVVDGLFMDQMQTHIEGLIRDANVSYVTWQKHSLTAAKQSQEPIFKTTGQATLHRLNDKECDGRRSHHVARWFFY